MSEIVLCVFQFFVVVVLLGVHDLQSERSLFRKVFDWQGEITVSVVVMIACFLLLGRLCTVCELKTLTTFSNACKCWGMNVLSSHQCVQQ